MYLYMCAQKQKHCACTCMYNAFLTLRVTVTMGEVVHLLLGLAQNPGGEGGGA